MVVRVIYLYKNIYYVIMAFGSGVCVFVCVSGGGVVIWKLEWLDHYGYIVSRFSMFGVILGVF